MHGISPLFWCVRFAPPFFYTISDNDIHFGNAIYYNQSYWALIFCHLFPIETHNLVSLFICRCGSKTDGPSGAKRRNAGDGRPSWPSTDSTEPWSATRCHCRTRSSNRQRKTNASPPGYSVRSIFFSFLIHSIAHNIILDNKMDIQHSQVDTKK